MFTAGAPHRLYFEVSLSENNHPNAINSGMFHSALFTSFWLTTFPLEAAACLSQKVHLNKSIRFHQPHKQA
jgi:hypothetical protein